MHVSAPNACVQVSTVSGFRFLLSVSNFRRTHASIFVATLPLRDSRSSMPRWYQRHWIIFRLHLQFAILNQTFECRHSIIFEMSTTVVFASCLIASIALASGSTLITVKDTADLDIETLTCHQDYGNATYTPKCKSKSCARRVTDGLFTELEIENLHNVVQKGMSQRPALGGPTILDINTGTPLHLTACLIPLH